MERLWTPWRSNYVGGQPAPGCVFCASAARTDDAATLIVLRAERCFVIMNLYPYNTGHLMIVPYRHIAEPEALTLDEWRGMIDLVPQLTSALRTTLRPDGFNVGMNIGAAAGAGIADHLHLHIVPRWVGDTNFMPVVGATKVLPELIPDTYARLRQALGAAASASTGDEAGPATPQAGAVVLVRDKVALRLAADGTWVLPKGHLEQGETLEQAAAREVAEEMGLGGTLGPRVGDLHFEQGGKRRHVTYFLFRGGAPLATWEEHRGRDTFLFSPGEALAHLTHPEARTLLERALTLETPKDQSAGASKG